MVAIEKKRNSNIDLVKFICAFGVICIHVQNSTFQASLIGDFFSPLCVPFFLMSALIFFISGLKEVDLSVLAHKIWIRIIIPYLSWTLIYFSLIMFKHYLTNQNDINEWWKILFFGASAVQMYYIPKMLIMQGFALAIVLIINKNFKQKLIGFVVFVVSFVWLFFGIKNNCFGFSESDYVTISIYIILAFGIVKLMNEKSLTTHYGFLGFTLFTLLLLVKYCFSNYYNITIYGSAFNICGGLSLILISFSLPPISFSKKAEYIFGFSYGIYLSHILFLEAFEFILKYLRINVFYDIVIKLFFSICILCCSILFIFFVKKNMKLKKYLLGE